MALFKKVTEVLPRELQDHLGTIPAEDLATIQEIRLRRGQPITLTGRGRSFYLSETGRTITDRSKALFCKNEWIDQTFDNACDHSVYAHQEELRHGYVTTRSGCRIGIAGTAVIKDGVISSFRSITSLCLRIAREHRGCAQNILPLIYRDGRLHSALICGEPSCGKTSCLKDLIYGLSVKGVHASIVDERGELSECGVAAGCDVLSHIPKPQGIEQAVRCLAPPLIILDELGDDEEIHAVTKGLYRGVPTVATIHCHVAEDLMKRHALKEALQNGLFEFLVFLKGKETPGGIDCYLKTEDWLRERDRNHLDRADRHVIWDSRTDEAATTGQRVATT